VTAEGTDLSTDVHIHAVDRQWQTTSGPCCARATLLCCLHHW